MITVDLVSCRQSRRPCSINSLPTSRVEAVEVEAFLNSQGSRKVNVEKSSIVYPSVIRARIPPNSQNQERSKPKIMEVCAKFSSIHPSAKRRNTVRFPCGVVVTGNPGVHLGVEYPLWNYEVLHTD
jgi:hypothetical protein